MRGVQILAEAPKMGRKMRKPRHSFRLKQTPWEIQPFMIAPVLPGETMKNALIQARAETPLVDDSRNGWHYEMYFFYVKHRDLMSSASTYTFADSVMAMHLDQTKTPSDIFTGGHVKLYQQAEGVDFVAGCLHAVTHWYFRSEGEQIWEYQSGAGTSAAAGVLPIASILQTSWADSAKNEDEVVNVSGDELPGQSPVLPDDVDPAFSAAFAQWEMMTASGLYTATFADYLRSFGITPPKEVQPVQDVRKPELLRYIRNWKYPQPSMVGGTTGFNIRWDIAERIDKDYFFAEPGFIFGVTVARPKVYFAKQLAPIVAYMNDAYSWLPAVLSDEPYTSLRRFAAGTGPIQGVTDDYWIDVKDLFLYGDQFANFATMDGSFNNTAADQSFVSLPTATLRRKYMLNTELRHGFAGNTGDIQVDGVVSLDIASRLHETSGRGSEALTFATP